MRTNPLHKFIARDRARGNTENHHFRGIDVCAQFKSIQHEKYFKRRVSDTFVAVDKRMIENQREAERRCFFFKRRIQLSAVERGSRLRHSGFERAQVANGKRATANGDDAFVQAQNFRDCEKARQRLREAAVESSVLLDYMLCRRVKIGFPAREQIAERRRHESLGRDIESVGEIREMLALRFGDFKGKTHQNNLGQT